MTLEPGQTILNSKYHIVRLIGEGGMARVWLAEELTFGQRLVALKEPRDDLLPDLAQEVRLRYQREVQICAALDKARVPNTVRVFTADPYGDTVLLAMEYMPGGDLAVLLKQHPKGLSLEQAIGITLDLLQALAGVHGHELEIVHRDVKPSNVLFDEQGKAQLADFGLAQLAGMSGRSQLAGGQHPGTPMYMAPEQARSPDMLLPAADLYAVGCILFEMLTGRRYKRVRPGTAVRSLRSEVPDWLEAIVTQALAEDPWDRWPDATEMAAAMGGKGEAAWREAEVRTQAQSTEEAWLREARRPRPKEELPGRAIPADQSVSDQKVSETATAAMQMVTKPGMKRLWRKLGIEMVTIPAGYFLYGDDRERVHLAEYQMSRTPVTNSQYKAFLDATQREAPRHWKDGRIPPAKAQHPVVYVSWHDAAAFCEWLGCRLPTEQEWEKGARGTDGREYPWGDEWQRGHCNTMETGIGRTAAVGRFPKGASPYGLLDMMGNIWEWCENWYDEGHDTKVLRGGSWSSTHDDARSALRVRLYPDAHFDYVGFRCVVFPTSS